MAIGLPKDVVSNLVDQLTDLLKEYSEGYAQWDNLCDLIHNLDGQDDFDFTGLSDDTIGQVLLYGMLSGRWSIDGRTDVTGSYQMQLWSIISLTEELSEVSPTHEVLCLPAPDG